MLKGRTWSFRRKMWFLGLNDKANWVEGSAMKKWVLNDNSEV